MPRLTNPYGVGAAQVVTERRAVRCPCCELPFQHDVPLTKQSVATPPCPPCRTHRPPQAGESDTDELRRLRDHAPRVRDVLVHVGQRADTASTEARTWRSKWQERGREVAAALSTRDLWRAQLLAVEELHQEQRGDRCSCGEKAPCATIRAIDKARRDAQLEQANRPR